MALRASFALSLGQRYLSLAVMVAVTMVVARLITPEQMGAFAVGHAIAAIFGIAANFGVSQYIVQERELSHLRWRSALGVVLVSAWTASAALWLLSGPIAAFYGQAAVAGVVAALAAGFLLVPLNAPAVGALQRDLRFGRLLLIGTVASAVQAATAVALAWHGYGGASLAWGMFAEQAGMAAMILVLGPRGLWRRPALAEWRRVVGVGRSVAGSAMLQQVGIAAPQLALGQLAGLGAAGFYNRAWSVQQLFQRAFMQGIKPVVLPAFARAHRDRRDVAAQYVRGASYLAVLCWPFFATVAIMAHPLVHALYGDQWFAAVPVVRVLALAALVMPVTAFDSDIYVAVGRSELFLRLQMFVQGTRVAAVLAAAAVGLEAVAAAVVLAAWLQAAISLAQLRGVLGLSVRALLRGLVPGVGVTGMAALGPLAAILIYGPAPTQYLAALAVAAAGAAAGWLAGVVLTGHPARGELAWALDRLRRSTAGTGRRLRRGRPQATQG